MARTSAREGRLSQRALHRAGRHRLRPDGLLRKPDQDAEHRCVGCQWPAVRQHAHDGAVFADALVHPDRAQPPFERDVLHHRGLDRLPRRQRQHPVRERHAVGDAAAEGLQHLRAGQVAPDARRPDFGGRPVRPLAARARVRALLRVPRRRHASVLSGAGVRQSRRRAGEDARGGLSPHRGPDRQGDVVHRRRQAGGAQQAVLHVLLPGRRPCAAPRTEGMGGQVQGAVRRRLGRVPREDVQTPEGAGAHPEGRRAVASRSRRAGLEHAVGRREEALRPHDGGVRRVPRATPTITTAGCSSS